MRRFGPRIGAFVALALVVGYGAAVIWPVAGWYALIAPTGVGLVAGAFGWTRRDRDILDVVGPSFLVAYAGYLGIAIARVPHTTIARPGFEDWFAAPLLELGALGARWPLVLAAGVPFALILTIAVALPIALIPVRKAQAQDRLGAFLRERNEAARSGEPGPGAEGRPPVSPA
jgi:hypothetical protein